MRKWGFTLVELSIVIAIVSILALMILPALARTRESAHRASCANNLKQLGVACHMYANENGGNWPLRHVLYGCPYRPDLPCQAFFDSQTMFPEHLTERTVGFFPSDSEYARWICETACNMKRSRIQNSLTNKLREPRYAPYEPTSLSGVSLACR